MASPTVAASPSRAGPTDILTAAPSPASPPRRLASAPPAVDASGSSSPDSAHSGDQLSAPDASSVGAARSALACEFDHRWNRTAFPFFFFPPLPWCVSDVARCLVVQSPLLASRSEEYRLLFRLPPDEVN